METMTSLDVDPTAVPPIPSPLCSPPTTGTLVVLNSVTEPVALFIGGLYSGFNLGVGQTYTGQFFPGAYSVDFIGLISGLPYFGGVWPVVAGETTVVF